MARDLDLELGSRHTVYRRASFTNLHLHDKIHWNRKKLFADARMYRKVDLKRKHHVVQKSDSTNTSDPLTMTTVIHSMTNPLTLLIRSGSSSDTRNSYWSSKCRNSKNEFRVSKLLLAYPPRLYPSFILPQNKPFLAAVCTSVILFIYVTMKVVSMYPKSCTLCCLLTLYTLHDNQSATDSVLYCLFFFCYAAKRPSPFFLYKPHKKTLF